MLVRTNLPQFSVLDHPLMRADLFDDMIENLFNLSRNHIDEPRFSFKEDDEALTLEVLVPGLTEKDLEVSTENGVLTVKGERHILAKEGQKYLVKERTPFKLSRSFKLSDKLNPEGITANLKDGFLSLTIPKRAESKPKKVTIKVA